jgi:pyridoxal biosynthesis lyase PdxS
MLSLVRAMARQDHEIRIDVVNNCEVKIIRKCLDHHIKTANLEIPEPLGVKRVAEIKLRINKKLNIILGPGNIEAGCPRITELIASAKSISYILNYPEPWNKLKIR